MITNHPLFTPGILSNIPSPKYIPVYSNHFHACNAAASPHFDCCVLQSSLYLLSCRSSLYQVFVIGLVYVVLRVQDGLYHTLLGPFPKLDCSKTKRVPRPNDIRTSSESSRRDICNASFLTLTDTAGSVGLSSTGSRPRSV